jgi:hypothetical protein
MARKTVLALRGATVFVLIGMLGITTAGCSVSKSSSGPVRSQVSNTNFLLVLELPKAEWHTTEMIDGTATLTLIGLSSEAAWGSGMGIVGFQFAEVGGSRKLDWVRTADCVGHQLEASKPFVAKISEASMVVSSYESDFGRGIGANNATRLPPGDWSISAVTGFADNTCDGHQEEMRAGVVIHVTA